MPQLSRSLGEIFIQTKCVRQRVRDTQTLRDYLILSKMNRMWVLAIDMKSGLNAQLMQISRQYARLSCDEEIKFLATLTTDELASVLNVKSVSEA